MSFDGRTISALPHDTVASALIANGVRTLGYAPQDGLPYGGYCFIGRCGECQMVIDGQPCQFACMTEARPGMQVETQHGHGHWGGTSSE